MLKKARLLTWRRRGGGDGCCRRAVDTVDAILVGVELVVHVGLPQGVGAVVQPAGIVDEVEVDGDARRHAGAVRLACRKCCRCGVEITAECVAID